MSFNESDDVGSRPYQQMAQAGLSSPIYHPLLAMPEHADFFSSLLQLGLNYPNLFGR
jgi:hypothetical protein